MTGKMRRLLRLAVATVAVVPVALSGCMPFSAGIFTPIPVPPWVSTRIEDRYQNTNDFRGVPYVYEEFRDNIQIVTERLVDKIDPPRFFPLVGWARLHHCHYKCTVYYTETRQSDYPFPYKVVKPRVQVVYIDKDHLHLEPCGSPEAQQQVTRDLSGP
jgi:hypothetical protein